MSPINRYLAWLKLHPEIWEVLTEEWLKQGIRAGDCCIGKEGGWIGYVVRMPVEDSCGSHRTSWLVVYPSGTGTFQSCYDNPQDIIKNWKWLPKSGQLVRMVLEAIDENEEALPYGTSKELVQRVFDTINGRMWCAYQPYYRCTDEEHFWYGEGDEPEIALIVLWVNINN